MNTYKKYAPNVYIAQCEQEHKKGDIITLTSKYGKETEVIIHNLVMEKDNFFYYSFVRADGYNIQVKAQKRAEKLKEWSEKADEKSTEYLERAQECREFLVLAEPIKTGHHSEGRHRALFKRNDDRMRKSVEFMDKAKEHSKKVDYWEKMRDKINLSMPESLEYYTHELEKAIAHHKDLKENPSKREHSMSLTYANKAVKDLREKVDYANKLWGDQEVK